MNIHVSNSPSHLKITQTMIEDFILDPVLAAKVIMGEELDAFQKVRLKICWWTPRVMDTSGFSSAKTKNMWLVTNLRCLIFGNLVSGIYYPSFGTGQLTYWKYFAETAARAPIYRAQIGRQRMVGVDGRTEGDVKATNKGPSCWTCDYRNGSQIMMPAPGFLQDAKTQAGLRFNDLSIDEWTKIEAMGSSGIDSQLIGRTTRASMNKYHPIFCNHHLFLATAEDMSHPSNVRYESYLNAIDAGDPDYAIIVNSFKDYSDLPFRNGQTFKEVFREERVLRDMKKNKSRAGYLQEGLGIWSRSGRGLYTPAMISQCKELGRKEKAAIYCSRREDPEGAKAHYFLGIDPSKADNKKADDGALVVLRAVPMFEDTATELQAFKLSFCWGYKVRKADATQWGGIVHRKHQQFIFTGICMDPGGGGVWIRPELAKSIQTIGGIRSTVKPIACLEDQEGMMVMADFILMMFRPQDQRVAQTWGTMNMRGSDNLVDIAHTEFTDGMQSNGIALPPTMRELGGEATSGWSPEKVHAAAMIESIPRQLLKLFVRTNADGTVLFTRQNARQFGCKGAKDFAYAGMMAYFNFLHWLRSGCSELTMASENAALCGGGDD